MAEELTMSIAEYFSERRGGRVLSPRTIEAITTFLVETLEVEDMEVVKSMDVDALVESLEKGDDKESPREVKAQKPVDAKEIDAIIEDGISKDDAFGGIPRAKGDW